jgi:phosphoglycerol transferase MdoB-like AlkP superfamily enzyme
MNTTVATVAPPRLHRLHEGLRVLACVLLILLAVGQLDPGIDLFAQPQADDLERLALNALPVLALFGLLLALTRRALLSVWFALLIVAGLYAANGAKLGALQAPLLPADLRFLAHPGSAWELFSNYLHFGPTKLALFGVAAAVTVALTRERTLRSLAGWRAAFLGMLSLLAGIGIIAGSAPWRRLYHSTEIAFQPWALGQSTARTGLIGSLLVYHWQIGGDGIPPADRKAALTLLGAHAPALRGVVGAASTADRPDIVVVQSESLFDPARLNGVEDDRWLRQYHRLSARGTSGNLTVPTYAGGTIRTEFEVLTGAPLASLGGVQYPWVELDEDVFPGLARTLGGQGYRTVAIHPNTAVFWNRDRAYKALGFEQFIDGAAFGDAGIVGLFVGDSALTDHIIDELANDGPPQFVFAISMENHGPFDWRPGLDSKRLAALPMPESLDEGGRLWFGNYLYLLDDADHELGRLADKLMKRKRRTLLLFYGDHLPDLGPVYAQLGFDDGRDAKQQPVPWLLLDNRSKHARHVDATSWSLGSRLLDAAGIANRSYFGVLATLLADDIDPSDAQTAAGLSALARLHLRGELDAVVAEALESGAAEDDG